MADPGDGGSNSAASYPSLTIEPSEASETNSQASSITKNNAPQQRTGPTSTRNNTALSFAVSGTNNHSTTAGGHAGGHAAKRVSSDISALSRLNWPLIDPPRWGWTVVGGIADVLTPHERARRPSTRKAYLKANKRKRDRSGNLISANTATGGSTAAKVVAQFGQQQEPHRERFDEERENLLKSDYSKATTVIYAGTCHRTRQHARFTQRHPTLDHSPQLRRIASSAQEHNPLLPWNQESQHKPGEVDDKEATRRRETTLSDDHKVHDGDKTKNTIITAQNEGTTSTRALTTDMTINIPFEMGKDKSAQSTSSIEAVEKVTKPLHLNSAVPTAVVNGHTNSEANIQAPLMDLTCDFENPVPSQCAGRTNRTSFSATKDSVQNSSFQKIPHTAVASHSTKNDSATVKTATELAASSTAAVDAALDLAALVDLDQKHQKRPRRLVATYDEKGPLAKIPKEAMQFCALCSDPGENSTTAAGASGDAKILDIYTYHRGREGMEIRDEETGDWLADIPVPTDTNHSTSREPDTSLTVQIQFPLSDNQMFRDIISYDLIDRSNTGITPMQLATDIALEFGLSFPETVDLAESIERQVLAYHRDHNPYVPPVAAIEPFSGEKRDVPSTKIAVAWHGQVSERRKPGCSLHVKSAPSSSFKPISTPGPKEKRSVSTQGQSAARAIKSKAPATANSTEKPEKSTPRPPPGARKGSKLDFDVEPEYREEVKQRMEVFAKKSADLMLEEMRASGTIDPSLKGIPVKTEHDVYCHLCRKKSLGVRLPCGQTTHIYCMRHTQEKLEISLDPPMVVGKCPMCALVCSCPNCIRKLNRLSRLLKEKSLEQNCSPAEVVFPDLWEFGQNQPKSENTQNQHSSKKRAPPTQGRPPSTKKRRLNTVLKQVTKLQIADFPRKQVPKVPISDLPREVCNGVDIDPGTHLDYHSTYSENGAEPPDGYVAPEKSNSPVALDAQIEDGSVDICNICTKAGNLICCDYCPRAFHPKCLKSNESTDETPWMCPSCEREKKGLPEDHVTGDTAYSDMLNVYGGDSNPNMIRVISMIHEMLIRLTNYDFGDCFAKPVVGVEGYSDIVKKPMDLGTIMSKLSRGNYKVLGALENVVVQALNDVELVWQNCFFFNRERSAVYRMAGVQRRRAEAIRMKSFDNLLTTEMKDKINEYRGQFGSRGSETEVMPTPVIRNAPNESPSKDQKAPIAPSQCPQKSRHKIMVQAKVSHAGRCVAILDPDTCRVVKIYSTITGASRAVEFLLGLKHECELDSFKTDTKNKVRQLINESIEDPSVRLFGYRWLSMDDLKCGKVKFTRLTPEEHQLVEGQKLAATDGNSKSDGDGKVTKNGESSNPESLDVKQAAPSIERTVLSEHAIRNSIATERCDENLKQIAAGVKKGGLSQQSVQVPSSNEISIERHGLATKSRDCPITDENIERHQQHKSKSEESPKMTEGFLPESGEDTYFHSKEDRDAIIAVETKEKNARAEDDHECDTRTVYRRKPTTNESAENLVNKNGAALKVLEVGAVLEANGTPRIPLLPSPPVYRPKAQKKDAVVKESLWSKESPNVTKITKVELLEKMKDVGVDEEDV